MIVGLRSLRLKRSIPVGWPSREWVSGCAAVAASGIVAVGVAAFVLVGEDTAAPEKIVATGELVLTEGSWTERLTDPSAWRDGEFLGGSRMGRPRRGEPREPEAERDSDDPEARLWRNTRGTYRTVCVRLCDGYFFPVSFATTPDRFSHDQAACQSSCRSPARLYIYPNPGGQPEQMTTVDGKPYGELKSAFLFRSKYDETCTCKAHPWEKEALDRHRAYAEAERGRSSGRRTVARTIRSETHPDRDYQAGDQQVRPEGAMLLGNDALPRSHTSAKPRDAASRSESAPPRKLGTRADFRTWRDKAWTND